MISVKVFGNGAGESILLTLPNQELGVVDCFASNPDETQDNHIYNALNENQNNVAFLCWTHPHDDHSRGLKKIIECFDDRIRKYWLPGNEIINQAFHSLYELDEKADLDHYIIKIYKMLFDIANKNPEKIRWLLSGSTLMDNNEITVKALSPPHGIVSKLKKKFKNDNLASLCWEKYANIIRDKLANSMSISLLIEYGKAKIILGGDTLKKAWKTLYQDEDTNFAKEPIQILKVPHHGSITSYYKNYWEKWTENGNHTHAIITSLGKKLPEENMKRTFNEHTNNCYILDKTEDSFGFDVLDQHILNEQNYFTYDLTDSDSYIESKAILPLSVDEVEFNVFEDGRVERVK